MSAVLRKHAVLELIAAAALWSTGGVLIKLIDWSPAGICGTRSAIAALFLIAVFRKINFHWSLNLWGAAVSYALSVLCFVAGTRNTAAANVVALQCSAPLYVTLLSSWALGEKVTKLDLYAVGLGILGVVTLVSGSPLTGRLGDLFGLGGGISIAAFIIFMRRQHKSLPIQSVILGNLLALIGCLPFIWKGGPTLPGWGYLALLGVVQLGLPYILYARAIRYLTAVEAALIPMFEPVLNPLWVFLFIGEVPGRYAIAGGSHHTFRSPTTSYRSFPPCSADGLSA